MNVIRLLLLMMLATLQFSINSAGAAPLRVDINSENRADMRTVGWENWQPAGKVFSQSFGDVTVTLRPGSNGGSIGLAGSKPLIVDGLTVGADAAVVSGGAYVTHGETNRGEPFGDGWISTGGTLSRESPARIAFLRKIVEQGPAQGLDPIEQYWEPNMAGRKGQYYLIYFGKEPVREWAFLLPDDELEAGMRFGVDLIDTWNMTITPVSQVFEVERMDRYQFADKGRGKVALPGKPYMALRIRRVD